MAQNVTVAGASYSDVPSVTLPKTGGGTASFTDVTGTTALAADVASGKYFFTASGVLTLGTASSGGGTGGVTQDANGYLVLSDQGGGGGGGDSWSWIGKNPTKMHTLTERVSFSDLGVGSWTYSTSASTLRAEQDYSSAISCDISQYDWLQLVRVNVLYDYGDWSLAGAAENYAFVGGYCAFRNPSAGRSNLTGGTAIVGLSIPARAYLFYTNTSGTAVAVQDSYGVYTNASGTYSSSGTYPNKNITWRKPTIQIRGNAWYFTQDALSHLDLSKSHYDLLCEVWRVDAGTLMQSWPYHEVPNILTNGLEVSS